MLLSVTEASGMSTPSDPRVYFALAVLLAVVTL